MRNGILSIVISMMVALFTLSISSLSAQAGARDFFKCKLTEGVKQADMEKLATDFMAVIRKEGMKGYQTELLWPLYSQDISRGSFYWSTSSPSAAKSAGLEEFWGDSEANKDVRERFGKMAQCESGSVYTVSDIK